MTEITKEQFWNILQSPPKRYCNHCKYNGTYKDIDDECTHPTADRKPFNFLSNQNVDDIKCVGYYHNGHDFDREVYEADWGNDIVDLWKWNGKTK